MTAHSILLVCSLLGQANAPQPPASGATDNKAANRYSDGRYGTEVVPKRAPDAAAERNAAERNAAERDANVRQPSSSLGDSFLRDQQAERDRYGNADQRGAVTASDIDEELPRPRSSGPAPGRDQPTDPPLRRGPLTPVDDPSVRATIPPGQSPATRLPDDTIPDAIAPVDAADAAAKAAAPTRPDPSNPNTVPSDVSAGDLPPREFPPRRIAATARTIEALATSFALPDASAFVGTPLTLSDALARRSDRDSRLKIAHAYWKLSASTAAHAFAVDEQQRLAGLIQNAGAAADIDRRLLDSTAAAAEARVHETSLVVVSSQHDLAEAIGGAAGESLPLSSDPPFLGVYATRFDEIFADRAAPTQLRAIHTTLATLHKAIERRAEAATTAVDALAHAEQAYLQGRLGVDVYLVAFNQASSQRQAFLAVARAYNDDIADYAINVARDGTAAAELTSMLIRVPSSGANDSARRTQPPAARSAANPHRGGVAVDRSQPVVPEAPGSADAGGWQRKNATPLR